MTLGDWAQIAGAAGTLLAVIVALFGPKLRDLMLKPRLRLKPGAPGGYKDGSTRWYHLRVENPRRWSPVTAVRVFLLEIEERGSPDDRWVGEVPIRWRFAQQPDEAWDLGSPRDCDLCAVDDHDRMMKLQPAIQWGVPAQRVSYVPPFHLQLTFQARGLEIDSPRRKVNLDWDRDKALVVTFLADRRG